MNFDKKLGINLHDDPTLFRESVNFTAAQTSFSERLIEKDYFCSVILEAINAAGMNSLVFKGGTCLAKFHADFYRLSEDLDFAISTPVKSSRSDRRKRVAMMKEIMAELPDRLKCLYTDDPFVGYNNSKQYIGSFGYRSLMDDTKESIKIEVSLREPLLTEPVKAQLRTILLNPLSNKPIVSDISSQSISFKEAMAEKLRAALTRKYPAIRDYFDLDYAIRNVDLDLNNDELINLVRVKVAIPGNDDVKIDSLQFEALNNQLNTRLKPVLRKKNFESFDLMRIFRAIEEFSEIISK